MGVSRSKLIVEAKRLLEKPLSSLGYALEEQPYTELEEFWFVKGPTVENGMFHIVEYRPGGFSDKDIFEMGINLIRRNFHDHFTVPPDFIAHVDLDIPLAPNLWISGGEKYYRWHFVSLSDARKAYKDMLEKLIEWGIPFLEDPDTNYELWKGWGIIWSKTRRESA